MTEDGAGRLDLIAFDRALRHLTWMAAEKAVRPMPARVSGARRLLAWQGTALALQVGVALAGRLAT